MSTTLSDEEFQRLQNQLLELKSNNYSLETSYNKLKLDHERLQKENDELRLHQDSSSSAGAAFKGKLLKSFSMAKNIANKMDSKLHSTNSPLRTHSLSSDQTDSPSQAVDSSTIQPSPSLDSFAHSLQVQEEEFLKTNEMLKAEIEHLQGELNEKQKENESLSSELSTLKQEAIYSNQSGYLKQFRSDLIQFQEKILEQHIQSNNFVNCSVVVDYDGVVERLLQSVPKVMSNNNHSEEGDVEVENDDEDEDENYEHLLYEQISTIIDSFQELSIDICDKDQQEKGDREGSSEPSSNLSILSEYQQLYTVFQQLFAGQLDKLKHLVLTLLKRIIESSELKLQIESKLAKEILDLKHNLETLQAELSKVQTQLTESNVKLRELEVQSKESSEKLESEFEKQLESTRKDFEAKLFESSAKIESLQTQLTDQQSEAKISEKKGMKIIKQLKRELTNERKRSESLQKKLKELFANNGELSADILGRTDSFSDFTSNTSLKDGTLTEGSGGGERGSSTGSWSYMMNEPVNGVSNGKPLASPHHDSQHNSGSSDNDFVQIPKSSLKTSSSRASFTSVLEQENVQLVSKLSQMQQDKWRQEEIINSLKVTIDQCTAELHDKRQLIDFYCIEGKSASTPSSTNPAISYESGYSHSSSSTSSALNRVVNFIKEKSNESIEGLTNSSKPSSNSSTNQHASPNSSPTVSPSSQADNAKLRRMVEEVLTKNMHLQQNLETLSLENMQLKQQLQPSTSKGIRH